MIWIPENPGTDATTAPAVKRVVGELLSRFDNAEPVNPVLVEELAQAVAAFLGEQQIAWMEESPQYLVMLISRALDAMGASREARKLLVFGSGLVNPALWEVSGDARLWVLDLRRITVASSDSALELVLFRCLSAAIESIADVWDSTLGAGALGLRDVARTAASLLHRQPRMPETRALEAEIREHCRRHLEMIGVRRGWEAVPQIIFLEIQP